jgi:hypothetical protein
LFDNQSSVAWLCLPYGYHHTTAKMDERISFLKEQINPNNKQEGEEEAII